MGIDMPQHPGKQPIGSARHSPFNRGVLPSKFAVFPTSGGNDSVKTEEKMGYIPFFGDFWRPLVGGAVLCLAFLFYVNCLYDLFFHPILAADSPYFWATEVDGSAEFSSQEPSPAQGVASGTRQPVIPSESPFPAVQAESRDGGKNLVPPGKQTGSSEWAFQEQARQWIGQLDADSYFLRQQARRQLEELLAHPATASAAAKEIRHSLADRSISLEVRHVLERLRRRFPEAFGQPTTDVEAVSGSQPGPPSADIWAEPSPPGRPTPQEIETLVRLLESDFYAERRWAADQLKRYLESSQCQAGQEKDGQPPEDRRPPSHPEGGHPPDGQQPEGQAESTRQSQHHQPEAGRPNGPPQIGGRSEGHSEGGRHPLVQQPNAPSEGTPNPAGCWAGGPPEAGRPEGGPGTDGQLAGLILKVLQARMSRGEISADLARWLDPLWERAWGVWLARCSSGAEPPPAQPEEIHRWLECLAFPASACFPERMFLVRQADRQLRIFLARDDQVPRVREAIERRLASGELSPEAQARLTELADLCRPAMVAEFWQQGQHRSIQHLLVGVPSQVPGAPRPSHFDYIDDTKAHCVSGSNLTPGDYPVGVAIPHPHQADAFFHLVNLPTPRRRMAYEYLVRRDMRVRLAEITRRTGQYYLGRGQPLSAREILLLDQLDQKEVSRFASRWLRTMPDGAIEEAEWEFVEGWVARQQRASEHPVVFLPSSRHGLLCIILADRGTQEASPGLLEALAKDHIFPPSEQGRCAWGWLAALAIAARDPWPEVDSWLSSLVPRTEPLYIQTSSLLERAAVGSSDPPQLGATAAGLLLRRNRILTERSEEWEIVHKLLRPARGWIPSKYNILGFRFSHPTASEEFLRWWKTRQVLRTSAG